MIQQWANEGAPPGDLSKAPAEPMFSNDSEIGMPDETYYTPQFTISATEDEYRAFVIPSGLATAKFLREVEIIPGNHEVVHHVLIYQHITGTARQLDAASPEPGYLAFGGPGIPNPRFVAGWVPGSRVILLPENMGFKIDPNADLVVQMHYPKGSQGKSDRTRINFFYTNTTLPIRTLGNAPALNHTPASLVNGPLEIPANEIKTFQANASIPVKASFLSVAPHMHYIGREIKVFGIAPGNDTIPLIHIPEWDFHWQGSYTFQRPVILPAGTQLRAFARYDNTSANPFNPSNPPQLVQQSEATTDEMLVVYFSFMAYQTGDEHIILDSTLLTSPTYQAPAALQGVTLMPNPATELITVRGDLQSNSDIDIKVFDGFGRLISTELVQQASEGHFWHRLDVSSLASGAYWLQIQDHRATQQLQFIKIE